MKIREFYRWLVERDEKKRLRLIAKITSIINSYTHSYTYYILDCIFYYFYSNIAASMGERKATIRDEVRAWSRGHKTFCSRLSREQFFKVSTFA